MARAIPDVFAAHNPQLTSAVQIILRRRKELDIVCMSNVIDVFIHVLVVAFDKRLTGSVYISIGWFRYHDLHSRLASRH